jgi:putative membrane protein
MMAIDFPLLNASLNGAAGLFIVLGWLAIKNRSVTVHKTCMLTALFLSAIFLASYLYYHVIIQHGESTKFSAQNPEAARWLVMVYYIVLGTHIPLAAVVVPLALWTAYLGLRDRLTSHVRLARWTLPLWVYVSVTGVLVYVMLYRL